MNFVKKNLLSLVASIFAIGAAVAINPVSGWVTIGNAPVSVQNVNCGMTIVNPTCRTLVQGQFVTIYQSPIAAINRDKSQAFRERTP